MAWGSRSAGRKGRARRRQRLKVLLLLGVALVGTELALAAYFDDTLRRIELDSVDARFAVRGERAAPKDLLVVAIDTATFNDVRLRWPFPRTLHADVLRNLRRAGARVIAYDVQFTEPSINLRDDLDLYDAASRARPVVFATTDTSPGGGHNVLGGEKRLRRIGARAGHALLPDDPNGVLRRMPQPADGLEPFAVATVETETGRNIAQPDDRTAWIDYAGPPGTMPTVSFSDVLRDRIPRAMIRGRTVVVGPSAPALQDVHPTSVGDGMAGAEIQANAIETVRRGLPLRSAREGWNVALIVLLGLVAPLASLRLSPFRALGIALAVGVAFLVGAQIAFQEGVVVAVVYPLAALVFGSVGSLTVLYFTETRERRRLRTLFARFVPEAVVDEVVDRAEGDLRLGGVRLECTVLFSDLRSFTPFAESLRAEQVIDVLNQYLGEMSEAVLDNGGTLVAFMGDGIMAVFGAPLEQDDHADRAYRAAGEMVGPRLERFNTWLREQSLSDGFKMGVGLNSGPVMSGNVGSERRLEYTAVGDTTNTAARLEGMTKGTPHQLFVSDATRDALSDPASLALVGDLEVRGRSATIRVWAPRSESPGEPAG